MVPKTIPKVSPAATAGIEEWRLIDGFEDFYSVSSTGRVRSFPRIVVEKGGKKRPMPGRIRKTPTSDGYPQVSLYGDGRKTVTKVHRLVAAAFLGPRPDGMEVLHGDGDRENNHISNLRYGTSAENSADMVKHGSSEQGKRTHCPKGHPYSPENTMVYAGRRNCRTCRLAYKRAYNDRKRIERLALGAEIAEGL